MTKLQAKNRAATTLNDNRAYAGHTNKDAEIKKERKRLVKIAKELCYPDIVIEMLKKATTEIRMTNIMAAARRGYYD